MSISWLFIIFKFISQTIDNVQKININKTGVFVALIKLLKSNI